MKKTVATLLTIALISLVSPLNAAPLQGTLKSINDSGTIKLGYRQDLPPMSFLNKEDIPSGYSIDLCTAIVAKVSDKLGKEIKAEYIPVTSENRFKKLADNSADIICGSTTKTFERQESVDFTMLTFVTGGSYLTLKNSKIQHNFDGKKVGVTKNTTSERNLAELFQETSTFSQIVTVNSAAEGLQLLLNGQIDAFSADQVILIGLMIASGKPSMFELLPDLISYEPYALALRKDDSDFRLVADKAIAGVFKSGEINTIYTNWFGKYAPQMPPILQALVRINSIPEK